VFALDTPLLLTAVPMIWVMIAGVAGSVFAYLVLARPPAGHTVAAATTG
jgi:hypothetical protein